MGLTKTRKARVKRDHHPGALKQKQKTIDALLQGLDALAAHAESAELGTAARIFYTAKEELVHWAVTMNFHESAQDRFINRRLYDNRLSSVEAFIARAVRDSSTAIDISGILGLSKPKAQPQAEGK